MLHSGGGMGRGCGRGSQRKKKSDNRDSFIKHGRWGCQQYSHFQYSSKYCVENIPERHLFQHTPFLTVLLAGRFKHFINNNWRSKYILNEIKLQNTINRSASAAENTTGKKVLKSQEILVNQKIQGMLKKSQKNFAGYTSATKWIIFGGKEGWTEQSSNAPKVSQQFCEPLKMEDLFCKTIFSPR